MKSAVVESELGLTLTLASLRLEIEDARARCSTVESALDRALPCGRRRSAAGLLDRASPPGRRRAAAGDDAPPLLLSESARIEAPDKALWTEAALNGGKEAGRVTEAAAAPTADSVLAQALQLQDLLRAALAAGRDAGANLDAALAAIAACRSDVPQRTLPVAPTEQENAAGQWQWPARTCLTAAVGRFRVAPAGR